MPTRPTPPSRHPICLLVMACVALSACAGAADRTRDDVWHSAERDRFMTGAPSATMPLVGNSEATGDAQLRRPSVDVPRGEAELIHLIRRMYATVLDEKGVGIAAPQVGVNRRVILVQRLDRLPNKPFEVYVNATLPWRSKETVVDWEGCLSVDAGFGQVRRAQAVEVRYQGRCTVAGVCTWFEAPHRERVEGFTARIFQHEVDHIDGVLFIDRKEPGPLMPEKPYRAMRAREKAAAKEAAAKAEAAEAAAAKPTAPTSEGGGAR